MIGMYAPRPYQLHVCNFCGLNQHSDGVQSIVVKDCDTAICDYCVWLCFNEIMTSKGSEKDGG